MATFKATEHLIKVGGNDYMPVPARVQWFRSEHPNGGIHTDVTAFGDTLIVRASVSTGDGLIIATGLSTVRSGQGQKWVGREVEKAETAAVGRALGFAGYGTQFAGDELDDTDYLSDSPQLRSTVPNSSATAHTGVNAPERPATPKNSKVRANDRWTAIIAGIKDMPHFEEQTQHAANAVKLLQEKGVITDDMTADEVIAFIRREYA